MLSADRIEQLNKLQDILNIKVTDVELLDVALTHPSFNFEVNNEDAPDYERLEFLGDSVLRLVISDYLFEKYPDYPEGKLTKIRSYLVSDEFLAKISFSLGLEEFLNIGEHEQKDGGRKKESINACAMEAILGAIYKNNGFEYVKAFLLKIYENQNINVNEILFFYNSKELLQQYTQAQNKDLPEYKVTNETGKAHNKTYEVCAFYRGEVLGKGVAKTKKEAEKIAALNALKKLKIVEDCING